MARLSDSKTPPLIIAEAADAHYGDLSRAKDMAAAAKDAGADVIKYQHHIPSEEMLRDIPQSSNMAEPLWDFLVKNALSISEHVELEKYCRNIGITYACTPFSLTAAKELEATVSPGFYKIGSGEMLDFPTLEEVAKLGKPMIISTGMSTVDEVDEMYNFMATRATHLVLMNCTSAYPTRPEDMHLSFISEMKKRYPKAIIGHSEHSRANHFSLAAVAMGARVIERHVTIDESLSGPDADVSLTFPQLKEFIEQVRELSVALNVPKVIQEREHEIREWAHRSLVYLADFEEGHIVAEKDIWGKRPGTGIPSRHRADYIGKTLKRSVKSDTLLTDDDFVEEK